MKSRMFLFMVAILVASLVLGACATPAATTEPVAEVKEVTAVIGFTASQTGNYQTESSRQTNGLQLWMKEVNEAGGLKLSDGTVVKFEAKFYDDESTKEKVQELYTRLATEDDATFLISPYSSGLADAAAVIAEQNGKIMITTGAASDSTYQKGYTLVYQAYTPASKYLTGAVDMLKAKAPDVKKIAFTRKTDNDIGGQRHPGDRLAGSPHQGAKICRSGFAGHAAQGGGASRLQGQVQMAAQPAA